MFYGRMTPFTSRIWVAWEASNLGLFEFLHMFAAAGLTHVLCTDIDRDRTLQGFNFSLYTSVKHGFPHLQLQASGGASRLEI